ncbi:MAG: hypothetical protein AAF202_03150 [Pseudomonadota bacterium]
MDSHIDPRADRFLKVILFFGILISVSAGFVIAEPWISNRFAQNCAGCHAPGRVNRPAVGRRCSLSCQGCHVNPQGGGLRNQYGKWNSQRWLRSFRSKVVHEEGTPAPLGKQLYRKRVERLGKGKKLPKKVLDRIPPHKTIKETHPPQKLYDKYSWKEWRTDVASDNQFQAIVPKDDPWRLERSMSTYAGADVRYFYGSLQRSTSDDERTFDGFMAVDVGLRARPFKYHKLSAVLEARIQDEANGDTGYALQSLDSQSGHLRSAYILWDDLPYNTYLQYGNTRPLFGNYSVNHESLGQQLSGFGGRPVFRTASFGGSPNIPFFLFNLIQPSDAQGISSDATLGNDDEGYLITVGGRWVTLGLSTSLSIWSTKRDVNGEEKTWDMYSLTAGGAFGDFILNFDTTRIDRERTTGTGSDGGNVSTFEAKYRLWREFYLQASYATSNVMSELGTAAGTTGLTSMAPGEATEIGYGLKAFLISGLEFDVLFLNREEVPDEAADDKFTNELTMFQLHAYF